MKIMNAPVVSASAKASLAAKPTASKENHAVAHNNKAVSHNNKLNVKA